MLPDIAFGYPLPKDAGISTFRSTRVHSLNSLLKDQSYHFQSSTGLRKIAKMSSKFFNPWNNSPTPSVEEMLSQKPNHVEFEMNQNLETSNHRDFYMDSNKSSSAFSSTSRNFSVFRPQRGSKEVPRLTNSNQNLMSKTHKSACSESLDSKRILVVKGMIPKSSCGAILTRISGGSLERAVFKDDSQSPSLELYFIFPKEAQKFFEYSQTGLFCYNGNPLQVEWASERNTEDISSFHPSIEKKLLDQISKGARRTLLFTKGTPKISKRTENHSHFPNQSVNFSPNFNIKNVIADLAPMGNIVEFTPLISGSLSFRVSFDDVRTAINIMRQWQIAGTMLNFKYSGWVLHYGKDTCEKPCLTL
ncbi:hypothetical protein PSN45_000657 [Yamadazyma tenuis]|uniref:Uncharacterized protein n=1 Tax=Candida tenuis (strain ATCC 10573 / BCRC 21748 / CBS 615 / JCM 9827 / NBRC 10315 / NRRL Y-1498 / VKM Y-70) TaxID=590646 RepID=G3B9R5_CANTC|nr:uncharacterized protein CANTEDRAFT_115407 [Yamadazyma tenuis ATCC 10573]EGV61953.1 hypothetical protein CANTEDRAFT_115407 [Yamadazyma tenuis ATCC 10573]WEJ93196.1 hypothetical protein PSN45_000657 [Yamadazyma tenuis]